MRGGATFALETRVMSIAAGPDNRARRRNTERTVAFDPVVLGGWQLGGQGGYQRPAAAGQAGARSAAAPGLANRAAAAPCALGTRCYIVPWLNGRVLVGATVEDAGFDERATAAGVRSSSMPVAPLRAAAEASFVHRSPRRLAARHTRRAADRRPVEGAARRDLRHRPLSQRRAARAADRGARQGSRSERVDEPLAAWRRRVSGRSDERGDACYGQATRTQRHRRSRGSTETRKHRTRHTIATIYEATETVLFLRDFVLFVARLLLALQCPRSTTGGSKTVSHGHTESAEAETRVRELSGWALDGNAIRKQFVFRDFPKPSRSCSAWCLAPRRPTTIPTS